MDYHYEDIKNFIEDKGVPEYNQYIVIQGMNEKHRYNNKLYKPP